MAVLVEAFTVVTRIETIRAKYPGGMDSFYRSCPEGCFCMDDNIVGVIGFCMLRDADDFAASLLDFGFTYYVDGEFGEIAVLDQTDGLVVPCPWLEFDGAELFDGEPKLSVCRVKGCTSTGTSVPVRWYQRYTEGRRCLAMDGRDRERRMVFLRSENGADYFRDIPTGQECYFENFHRKRTDA